MDIPTIRKIKDDLNSVKSAGNSSVDISRFITYLEQLETTAGDSAQQRELLFKAASEMFRSVMKFGLAALKTSLLINGGATIALLGFLSNVLSKQGMQPAINLFTTSLVWFGVGVLCGGIATSVSYLAQSSYHRQNDSAGDRQRRVTIFLVTSSYVCFIIGLIFAAKALTI